MHIYERLEIRRVINAYECLTSLGGSIMPPEVLSAMSEASEWFVNLDELQERVGQRIADLVGVEAAFVTNGAAAGLTIATAACVAGSDPKSVVQLPNVEGMKNEVVIERSHRNRYDSAIRQTGVSFVEYGYPRGTKPWELEAAITSQTAAIAYFVTNATESSLPLPTVSEIARRHDIPVIVDAAAELPPSTNMRRFVDEGGDLVVFSGGKGLRGPQSSGVILGRRDLVDKCAANASPHQSIGRSMKVGKEEMVGLCVAIETYLKTSTEERLHAWESKVQTAIESLCDLPGIEVERVFPMPTGKLVPRALVRVTESSRCSSQQIIETLRSGSPSIEVRPDPRGFFIDPQNLQDGEVEIICERIGHLLNGDTIPEHQLLHDSGQR